MAQYFGDLHPSIYVGVFACVFMGVITFHTWKTALVIASCVTAGLYMSSVGFCLGTFIIGGGYLLIQDMKTQDRKLPGTIRFSYNFFDPDDNRFAGYTLTSKGGASTTHLSGNEVFVPDSFNNAVDKAVYIDPFNYCDGTIVVTTEVAMEKGKPVIYDHIVTYEQLENRYRGNGYWDKPEDYRGLVSDIVMRGDLEVDDTGHVNLKAPEGMLGQFLSQFNGPKLTRVRRN